MISGGSSGDYPGGCVMHLSEKTKIEAKGRFVWRFAADENSLAANLLGLDSASCKPRFFQVVLAVSRGSGR
jgi:hypothetical protein